MKKDIGTTKLLLKIIFIIFENIIFFIIGDINNNCCKNQPVYSIYNLDESIVLLK